MIHWEEQSSSEFTQQGDGKTVVKHQLLQWLVMIGEDLKQLLRINIIKQGYDDDYGLIRDDP